RTRDCVHRGTLHYPHRICVQFRAGHALVSATDRDADCDFHRLHGAGKYRGWAVAAAPLDDRIRFWADSRLRLLVRVADDAAVRRLPPAGVVTLIQRRCGTGAAAGTLALDSRASIAFSIHRRRAHRCDHSFGPGGPHGLALDARTRRPPTAIPYPVA